jgi:festuclavine dehydrogenase
MTILLLPGTAKTSLAIASLLHGTSQSYMLGVRTSTPSATYTDPSTSLTHPTLQISYTDASTHSALSQSTLRSPLTTLYLLLPPIPNPIPETQTLITNAITHGIQRIVFLSSSLIPRGGPAHGQIHAFLHEMALAKRLEEYAVLRPSWFATNFVDRSMGHVRSIGGEKRIYSATRGGRVPFVDVSDIAAVAMVALTSGDGCVVGDGGGRGDTGREYLILGPELLSYDDVARMYSDVLEEIDGAGAREIEHVNLTVEELAARHVEIGGMTREYAEMLAGLDGMIAEGLEDRLEGGCVRWVLGREARTLKEVLRENLGGEKS